MTLKTQNSAVNNHQQFGQENALWHEIPESAQMHLHGGMNGRIRIKLKSYDHRALDESSLVIFSETISSQPFMRWRDRFLR